MLLSEILINVIVIFSILMMIGFIAVTYCLILCISMLMKEVKTSLKYKPHRPGFPEKREKISPFNIDKVE